jgi:succinoglycan biosynthesis protein ExoL
MNKTASPSEASVNHAQLRRGRVVYVTPDCTDSAVQKRVHGFLGVGMDVVSFSFRRARYNVEYVPDWPNIELGTTTERQLLTRAFVMMRALWLIFRHRRTWREATVVYARNLDLALLALVGKSITRCPAPFVYEVLDIHPATTGGGYKAAFLRWLERRVLARSELLVISSPAFLENYFQPLQRYQGESFVMENKWHAKQISTLTRNLPYPLEAQEPIWTIGWFGNIRCAKSLEILTELADALPDRVRIYIRGCASLLGEQELMNAIGSRKNMIFAGEYAAPGELPAIYSNVHFNWCVDLCGGDNSQWLLPNRLYEGGYFGVPAIAIEGHETGRVVSQRNLGITLQTPAAHQLRDVLSSLSREDYEQMRQSIESLPAAHFVDYGDLAQLMRSTSETTFEHGIVDGAGKFHHLESGKIVD